MIISVIDKLYPKPKDGTDGKNGSSSRTRYALSQYDETGNNLTAPSDITAPTQAYTDSTNNTVKYSDWGGWSLEMPKPTDAKPYIWAVTYILVDPANEYLVSANGTEALHFARISGPKGDKGDKGDQGDKGDNGKNGSASRIRYALSKVTVSADAMTPPSDVSAPNTGLAVAISASTTMPRAVTDGATGRSIFRLQLKRSPTSGLYRTC